MFNSINSINSVNIAVKSKSIDVSNKTTRSLNKDYSFNNVGDYSYNNMTQRNTNITHQNNTVFPNSNVIVANDLSKLKEELLVQLVKAQDLYILKNEMSNNNLMLLSKMNSFLEDMSMLRTYINNDLPGQISSIINISTQNNNLTRNSLTDEFRCPDAFTTVNYSDVVQSMNAKIIPHMIALIFNENKLSEIM
jgi:hypothetical protein